MQHAMAKGVPVMGMCWVCRDRLVLASSAVEWLEGCKKSCVSVLRKSKGELQHLNLPTKQETACVLMSSASRLFAAGALPPHQTFSLGKSHLQMAQMLPVNP